MANVHIEAPKAQEEAVVYVDRRRGSDSSSSDIDYHSKSLHGLRRCYTTSRNVIRARTPPAIVRRIVTREPTPEPAVVEKLIVVPEPQRVIEKIIERPRTPPPVTVTRRISEAAPPPIVTTRVVSVSPTRRCRYVSNTPRRIVTRNYNYENYYGAPSYNSWSYY
jgi:hypothetical protein